MDDPGPQFLFLDIWSGISFQTFDPAAIYLILIVLTLLACSALISGSEVAYFSFSPAERQELEAGNDQQSKLIVELLMRPRRLLATILVANNFVNICIIILSTILVSKVISFGGNQIVQFAVEVISITAILLLFGEVVPKVYATRKGQFLAGLMALPLMVLSKMFYPVTYLLINFTAIIENRIKWKGKSLSSEDLSQALELTSEREMQTEDQRILEGIVKFGNTDVKQIMVSRVDVVSIKMETNFRKVLDIINSCKYSRIPVFEESFDNVSGILYIKDLLPYLNEAKNFKWQELIRKPIFVPENKKIDDLLKEFQEQKVHLAVVVDEYGGTSGIVTLEDILGEIVGDISEEIEQENGFQKIDDKNYLIDGKVPLIDLYKILPVNETEFENSKGESDTLAGFVIEISGRIPRKNEKIKFGNVLFTIESANVKKIKEVKLTLVND